MKRHVNGSARKLVAYVSLYITRKEKMNMTPTLSATFGNEIESNGKA